MTRRQKTKKAGTTQFLGRCRPFRMALPDGQAGSLKQLARLLPFCFNLVVDVHSLGNHHGYNCKCHYHCHHNVFLSLFLWSGEAPRLRFSAVPVVILKRPWDFPRVHLSERKVSTFANKLYRRGRDFSPESSVSLT